MIQRQKVFALLLVFAVVLAPLGCSDSDYRKATRAAAGIATGLGALEDANESLYKSGLLEKEEARAIAQGVIDATRVNDQLVGKLRTIKSIDASNKQLVGLWVGEVISSLGALNQQGVLRVKNPDAKSTLSVIFAGVQSSAAIITQLMSENGIPLPALRVFAIAPLRSLPPGVSSSQPRPLFELPAAFDVEVCARGMVTSTDVEILRCPKRAELSPISSPDSERTTDFNMKAGAL